MKIEDLQMNPFTKIGKEWGLVTAGTKESANMMTVSWGGVGVLWSKNVVYIFIRDSRYTKQFIDDGQTFSLSFFDEKYRDALNFCGSKSGRDYDKWAQTGLTCEEKDGAAYPREAKLVFLCRKMAAVPIGQEHFLDDKIMPSFYADHDMHVMYVGEILDVIG